MIKVWLANGQLMDVVGMGDVDIKQTKWLCLDIVQDQKTSYSWRRTDLIYVGQLDHNVHVINFGDVVWKVTKGAVVVDRDNKMGTLYMTTAPDTVISIAEASSVASIWHYCIDHMSQNRMKELLS